MTQWVIYSGLLIALLLPIVGTIEFKTPRNVEAENFFQLIEDNVKPGDIVFVSLDFGPGTAAENLPQANTVTEHLFRKGAKILFLSFSPQAEPFLSGVPTSVTARLKNEGLDLKYGEDYAIAGFRPAPAVFLQRLVLSQNLAESLENDIYGTRISTLPLANNLKSIRDVSAWFEFTGLAGMVQNYIQYLNTGNLVKFFHGCTSVIVPEAYIYKDSKQILGLLEGITGGVVYDELLSKRYENRARYSEFSTQFQSLSLGQLYILFLILLGNLLTLIKNVRN